MIYNLQVIDQGPRPPIDLALSATEYQALHALDSFASLQQASRAALVGVGVEVVEPLYVSVGSTEVTDVADPDLSAADVEAQIRERWDASEATIGGSTVRTALKPLIMKAQKQTFWRELFSTGQKVL